MSSRRTVRLLLAAGACLAASACGAQPQGQPGSQDNVVWTPPPTPTITPPETPTATGSTTVPDTLPGLPGTGFRAQVTTVPAEVLARSTWDPSCDITPDRLKWIVLTFRGFDGSRHTGELLVNESVAPDVVEVFRELWDEHYALHEMAILSKTDLVSPPPDVQDTSAYVCRPHEVGYSPEDQGLTVDVSPPGPEVRKAFEHVDWTWAGPTDPTRFTAP